MKITAINRIASLIIFLMMFFVANSYSQTCQPNHTYWCRYSNCVWECKCVKNNQFEKWLAQAKPCNNSLSVIDLINRSELVAFSFSFQKSIKMNLKIYDMHRRLIVRSVLINMNDGHNHVAIDTRDFYPGTYLLQLQSGENVGTKKFSVLK